MAELTPQQQQQVEQLFERALDVPPDQRRALLESSCDDSAVKAEVESLLAALPAAGELLDSPIADQDMLAETLEALSVQPGVIDQNPVQIGPYRILERIGEGGMGVVYLAGQDTPVRRRVALKIIKLGMNTRQVVARFETERQALALMSHPNVAKVFDAGVSDEGRPYFVMEHVPGVPITDYCDEHRLATKDRLGLIIETCQAIQHAHQKGIIHRDIKPSNVLVAVQDGKPVPKVIDFGVAKAVDQRLTEQTMFTEHGQLIGTPGYMSPEQADLTATDIDTRVDVYSLGVLLYELLVGSRPFDETSLREAGYAEIQRIIREVEPPKPSTRLSGLGETSTAIADSRSTQARTLSRQLRGDLDWIVMKCLEKDRTRRYDTASALMLDLQRHLANEPVLAGPPSVNYRAKKFVRRNRGLVGGIAAVFIVLAAGIVSTAIFAARESRQRVIAQTQAETARAVNSFLKEMLASVDPKQAEGREVGVLREILDQAATKVEAELSGQPKVEATVRRTIGQTYMNLGLHSEAAVHLDRALEVERASENGPNADLANSLYLLGVLRDYQGLYPEAEALLGKAVAMQRDVLGPHNQYLAASLSRLAVVMLRTGKPDRAKAHLDEAIVIVEKTHAPDAPFSISIRNTLAGYHMKRGEFAEAEALFRGSLATAEGKPDDADAITWSHNLATALREQKRYDESATLFAQAMEGANRIYGPEHQLTLAASNGLAVVMERQERYAESESLHREVLAVRRRTLGDKHPDVQSSLNNLASVLSAQDKLDECITIFREALDLAREIRNPSHPLLALAQAQLGFVLRDTADPSNYSESERLILSALAILDSALPSQHPFIANTLRGLHRLYDEDAMNDPAKLSEIETRLEAIGEHKD